MCNNVDRYIYERNKVVEYEQFINPCLNSWCKYYADKIADKIFSRCATEEDILTKYNNKTLVISIDKMFSISIENIINKYQSYKSFSNIEPDYYGWKPDLVRSCHSECNRRWGVELLD